MAKTIIIIEDDKFLQELVSQKLIGEGYEVVVATNGEDGIKKIREIKPDLVLLDLILPGMDGFEILEKIKRDSEVSSVPVVILSNIDQKEDMEKGFRMGAADFLIKAYSTPGEVVDKIKAILNH